MFSLFSSKNTVSISPSIVIFTLSFLLGLVFLYYIRPILILLFLSFIIMVALNPSVRVLHTRLKVPRAVGAILVYLLALIGFISLFTLIVPPLSTELYSLLKTFNVPPVLQEEIQNFRFTLEEVSNLAARVGTSVGVIYSIVSSTFSGIFTFFTLIVMSFYLMLDRPYLHQKVKWFTRDERHVTAAKEFLDSLEFQLGGWVRGQLILMILIGVITYIGLTLLSVPYALPLAILAGLLEILPNIGPVLASIPAIILAYLSGGPVMGGVVAIFYLIVQQLENNIIVPKIMKDSVDVNPLVAIVTILIGLELGGVVGAILAVPTYIVVRTAYGMWYRNHHSALPPA